MKNIFEIIEKRKHSNKNAIVYNKESITYKNLWESCISFSNYIISKINLEDNSNIAIFMPNSINYTIAYFSISITGIPICPISTLMKDDNIKSIIESCDIKYIITESRYLERFNSLKLDCKILMIDKFNLNKVVNSIRRVEFNEYDTAVLIPTSGSTGTQKIVALSHKNLLSNIESYLKVIKYEEDDKPLLSVPLYSSYGNFMLLAYMYKGVTLEFMNSIFTMKKFFEIVQLSEITHFITVPSVLNIICNTEKNQDYNLASLRFIGFSGSPPKIDLLNRLIEHYPNAEIVQGYGMTEASPVISIVDPKNFKKKLGSVGQPLPDVNVYILSGEKYVTNCGVFGEIVVSGNNIMKGYYKNENKTKEVIRNNFLHTGDIGSFDEDGYLYLLGRSKNIIITGGFNVFPEEVESVLLEFKNIEDAYVFGRQDDILGEIVCAKIVCNKKDVDLKLLEMYCLGKLANYKIPREIEIVEKLEKTEVGKIKRVGGKN